LNDHFQRLYDDFKPLNGHFQRPNDDFQSLNGHFQRPNDNFQSLKGHFQRLYNDFQSLNDQFQRPNDDFKPLNGHFQQSYDGFQSFNGHFQQDITGIDYFCQRDFAAVSAGPAARTAHPGCVFVFPADAADLEVGGISNVGYIWGIAAFLAPERNTVGTFIGIKA
jgi:hypothetical protein